MQPCAPPAGMAVGGMLSPAGELPRGALGLTASLPLRTPLDCWLHRVAEAGLEEVTSSVGFRVLVART